MSILEILKENLNTNTGLVFIFDEENSSFSVDVNKKQTPTNMYIINGQVIQSETKDIVITIKIKVIGDFDECWITSENGDYIPICTVGYIVYSNDGENISEIANYCEAIYNAEEIYETIKELYNYIS